MESTMIDKKMADKPVQFELSMGNAGNTIDGQMQSLSGPAGGKGDSTQGSPAKHDIEHDNLSTTGGFEEPGKI